MEIDTPGSPMDDPYKIMADNAPAMMWVASTDTRRIAFNAGWLRFTGRTLEQEQGDGWIEGVHPDDRSRLEIYAAAVDGGRPFRMAYRLRRHDGVYQWVSESGAPRYLEDGTYDGFVGSCINVDLPTYPVASADLAQADLHERNEALEVKIRSGIEACELSEMLLNDIIN